MSFSVVIDHNTRPKWGKIYMDKRSVGGNIKYYPIDKTIIPSWMEDKSKDPVWISDYILPGISRVSLNTSYGDYIVGPTYKDKCGKKSVDSQITITGKCLVAVKKSRGKTIWTGSIKEEPIDAISRELAEECGFVIKSSKITDIQKRITRVSTKNGNIHNVIVTCDDIIPYDSKSSMLWELSKPSGYEIIDNYRERVQIILCVKSANIEILSCDRDRRKAKDTANIIGLCCVPIKRIATVSERAKCEIIFDRSE
jgi:hypothetical protein